MRREPFAARRGFYPSSPGALAAALDRCLPPGIEPRRVVAVAVPHAGYSFSGGVAGKVYATIEVPDHVIVLCPKHTPFGASLGIMTSGSWAIPGGEVPVDEDLASRVREACGCEEDAESHAAEHSLEVQLPFLLRRNPAVRLTPIAVGIGRFERLRSLGEKLAETIRAFGKPVLIVASTDMSHEQGLARVKKHDPMAIGKMLALDAEGLFRVVTDNDITMCGYAPTTATIVAARTLGANRGELVDYETSLDHGGTEDWVVGYAGVVFE